MHWATEYSSSVIFHIYKTDIAYNEFYLNDKSINRFVKTENGCNNWVID